MRVGLVSVEQAFADHGNHEVCVVWMRNVGSALRACTIARRSSIARMCRRCNATAIAGHSPAPRRPEADNIPNKAISASFVTLCWESAPLRGRARIAAAVRVLVGHLVGHMVGDEKIAGVPGNQIHAVDAQEVHEDRRHPSRPLPRAARPLSGSLPACGFGQAKKYVALHPKDLLISRMRPRDISSRRYASMAR